jgi:hypothetical protein
MKRVFALLFSLLFASTSLAWDDAVVRWRNIVGVITAPGVSNTVAGIHSGGLPWTVAAGKARLDLSTGAATFFVEGLVLVGGNASGTPGPVTSVKGTLVCNPGSTNDQAVIDTPAVPLDAQGNADFDGKLLSTPPSSCANPLFLIRVAPADVWIATGASRTSS